jgi:acyl transferase domain-containing protein/NAD(P)-dependent dehydrogenase (short-subunit alcohol dehydrogenase family)
MKTTEKKLIHNVPVAITGMGCFFPKSSGLKEYWRLLFHGEDAITDIPESHWSPEDYFNIDPKKPDHIYCKRGGFLSPVSFDPTEFGIPPSSLEATDTSQLLGLVAAKTAIEDSGYKEGNTYNHDRTSVILGVTGTQELVIPLGARLGHPIWQRALEDSGINPAKTKEVVQRISDSYVSWQENSFPGLLGNVVAGRICNRLDLGGTNCVVDAACASSLSAIHLAVMELLTGRSDMVVTGGVDTLNDIFMHMCFSKTQVLSPTGDVRPFSKDADGTVLGEGIGIFVLKRLEDAEKQGDRIYAVIKAVGSSSDGKSQSIYAPRAEGQTKALQMAFKEADIDPATVELVEAHGTGTRVGDEVEFQALNRLFKDSGKNGRWCALGSVKSNIGHTKAAAGAAGLMKAALSLYNKVLPPTLKAHEPDPKLNIHQSPFYLNTEARPWFSKKEYPRRSGVSAFGFGGSNFHVVIEEYQRQKKEISWDGSVEIVALSASTKKELEERLHSFKVAIDNVKSNKEVAIKASGTRLEFSSSDPYRLLIVLEQSMGQFQDLAGHFDNAFNAIESDSPQNGWQQKNIYYGGHKKPGKIAFVFPGQGSQYIGMGRDLVCIFPDAFNVLEKANQKYENYGRLTDIIYPHPDLTEKEKKKQEEALRKTDIAQPAIGAVSISMLKVLQGFGIKPDATCGHSFGELTALCAAGWIDLDTLLHLSITRGSLMAASGRNKDQNNGGMLAVKAPIDELVHLIKETKTGVILANRNSPDQGVLSGSIHAIAQAEIICKERGIKTVHLPVSAAFHSNLVKDAQEPFIQTLKKIDISPSDIPVFSNTTGKPYPSDPDKAKKLLGEHLLCPVDFVSEIENLFKMGVKTFVEVGPKSVLTGLIKSILINRDFQAIALDGFSGRRSKMADFAGTLCHLASLGHDVDLSCWEHPAHETKKQLMSIPISGVNYRRQSAEDKRQVTENKEQKTENRRGMISAPISGKRKSMNKNQKQQQDFIIDALQVVQEGLKSMQTLQMQTAETHKKFLEAQIEASRTIQNMMDNIHSLAEGSLGLKTEQKAPDFIIQKNLENTPIPDETAANINNQASYSQDALQMSERIIPPAPPTPSNQVIAEKSFEEPDVKPNSKVFETSGYAGKEIENSMLEVVSQLTGYPIEMLNMDMDIEADLGIDSIKRVEILSTLEEKNPDLPSVSPEIMGSLKTLGQVAEYLSGASKTNAPQQATVSDTIVSSAIYDNKLHVLPDVFTKDVVEFSPEYLADKIKRRFVSIINNPISHEEKLSIPENRKIFITDDKTGLSKAIAEQFTLLNIEADLVSKSMFSHIVKGDKVLENAAGLVIVSGNEQNDVRFLKDAFAMTKHLAKNLLDSAVQGDSLFATITRLDGAFGYKGLGIANPLQGGLAGLAKTASLEWENVCCHAIDVAPDWKDNKEIAKAVVDELLNPDSSAPVEIGLDSGSRFTLELEASPYPQGEINLDPGDVVVISGGARGVTAHAAHALAKHAKPTLVLLGRSPHPTPEPEWLAGVYDEASIKKAIFENEFGGNNASPIQIETSYKTHLANREIMKNLEKMRLAGSTVLYYPVDIIDFRQVKSILDDVRSSHGPVKGIIHGAGTLEDRLIIDKTMEQFEKVFDTKVKGLNVLLEATKLDTLKYLVIFSSVTARIGNNGQVDYAMANEALNKVAQQESIRQPDCKVISINWGPWDGGMVCSALKLKFEKCGVDLIPMDAGAMCMIYEMMGDKSLPVEVVIGANIIADQDKDKIKTVSCKQEQPIVLKKKEQLSLTLQREIDVDRYPILGAHILDGKPVVPFALIAEWLGHGALHENPGLFLHGLDDMRIFHGIKLDHEKILIRLLAGKASKKGSTFEVNVEIRDGIKNNVEVIHSKATAILKDKLDEPPSFNISEHIGSNSYSRSIDEIYEKILFHGLELRGIKEIIGYSSRGIAARISSAPSPAKWMKDPLRSKWISDPLILDSAFQMAIIWCFEEMSLVSLPSYSASYRQYRNNFPSDGVKAVLEVKEVTNRKMKGDFTFLDADDVVVAQLTGYEAVMDPSLSKAFKSQNAA